MNSCSTYLGRRRVRHSFSGGGSHTKAASPLGLFTHSIVPQIAIRGEFKPNRTKSNLIRLTFLFFRHHWSFGLGASALSAISCSRPKCNRKRKSGAPKCNNRHLVAVRCTRLQLLHQKKCAAKLCYLCDLLFKTSAVFAAQMVLFGTKRGVVKMVRLSLNDLQHQRMVLYHFSYFRTRP